LLDRLLYDIPYEVLGQTPLMFSCSCTRDQTGAILRTLGREELEQLMQEHEVVTVTCEFCKERYRFDQQALEALMAQQ
jgi:molecular chaperone Hsp33